MKKIIIIFSVIFIAFTGVFAEKNFREDFNSADSEIKILKKQLLIRDKLLLQKNKNLEKLQEKISELDDNSSERDVRNSFLKKNIDILSKQKLQLQKDLVKVENDLEKEKDRLIGLDEFAKKYYKILERDYNNINDDDKVLYTVFVYTLFSIGLYLFFLIFTLPWRLLRAIWRKITGYKECNGLGTKEEIEGLTNRYKKSVKQVSILVEDNGKLVYEIGELKNKIFKIKTKKQKIFTEKTRKKIEEKKSNFQDLHQHQNRSGEKINKSFIKKDEEIFIFDTPIVNKKKKFSLFEKTEEKTKLKLKKENILNDKIKVKTRLFEKKKETKKEKFSLVNEKNKKSKLFE